MEFTTADEVINNAAVELGLKSADIADPFASSDPNILLLIRLLSRVGKSLVRARDWTHLTREYTFNTASAQATYTLPSGFNRMKNETQWNRTTVNPLGPPVDGVQWQAMQARTSSGLVTVPFRILGNLLYIYPTPTAIEAIYYEFITNFWVSTLPAAPTASAPIAITQTLWFDESLLVAGLKLAFKRAKGMDTSAAQDEFNQVYEAVAGADGAAAPISLSGGSARLSIGSYPGDSGQWGI
jgi:hypothetical protein